jgi:hypothetical protein
MSGNYQAWNAEPDVPGGITESAQAVRDGLAQAVSAYSMMQSEASAFQAEYGAAVLPGHAPVNAPGRQGDPDVERDASDG